MTGITRAIVLNNLAFLVALAGNEAEAGVDPLKLVEEAEQILGPTADILDTRGRGLHHSRATIRKRFRILNYAVTDNPTARKYFHKAVAHLGAGENTAAIEAWDKAAQPGGRRPLDAQSHGVRALRQDQSQDRATSRPKADACGRLVRVARTSSVCHLELFRRKRRKTATLLESAAAGDPEALKAT